jgi:hypothetical protein
MEKYTVAALALGTIAVAIGVAGIYREPPQSSLKCVEATSSGRYSCRDAGGFDGTCATATCPAGYTMTGGGGICTAGNIKLKGVNPKLSTGEFFIMCEPQGVDPQARAICCKL